VAAKNPCTAELLAARVAGSAGDSALRAWADQVRHAIAGHGDTRVPGLGRFMVRPRDAARELAFAPNLGLLEELNGVNVVSTERDPVVTAIVRALRDGHDTIELPGLGTLLLDRPPGARACLAFHADAAFTAALQESG
jgi:hypothetical protein